MAVAEDKSNTLAIVTIGVASVVLLWASIVALQAYYENSFGAEMHRKATEGKGDELRTLLAEQRAGLQALRRNDEETVRIPIERAKQLVVAELRTGEPASLVPAVGPHTTPTVPAEWGRPPDDARVSDEDGVGGDEDGEADETAEDIDSEAGAEDAEAEASDSPSPTPAQRGIDSPEGETPRAPSAGQEGDDAEENAPGRDVD
jgi:hypothetical protein